MLIGPLPCETAGTATMYKPLPDVAVDLEKLRHINCGLGRFCLHLGRSLLERDDRRFSPTFLLHRGGQRHFRGRAFTQMTAARWRRESVNRLIRPLAPLLPRPRRYALWHSTNQMSRYLPLDPRVPVLLTVHDLNFLHDPRKRSARRLAEKLADVQRRVTRAVAVVTDSQFVADELRSHVDLGARPIHVVPLGLPEASGEQRRPDWLPARPFVLSVGNCLPHKNFHSLLALLEWLPGMRLVIAGKSTTDYGRFVQAEAARMGLGSRVSMPGEVPDAEREWLYRHCDAFLFPSLAEGFGFPALEAMAAGRPVFVSRHASLPELVGEHAAFLDGPSPREVAALVLEGIARFDRDPRRADRARVHATSFTWSETARQYADLYCRYMTP
jgi:glycosyltransferase involved in cell wall biosynthesis